MHTCPMSLMQLEHDVHLNVDNSNFTTLVFTLCARRHVLKLSYARTNRSSMLLPPHHFRWHAKSTSSNVWASPPQWINYVHVTACSCMTKNIDNQHASHRCHERPTEVLSYSKVPRVCLIRTCLERATPGYLAEGWDIPKRVRSRTLSSPFCIRISPPPLLYHTRVAKHMFST